MARTASMTTAEAEAVLGPRGALVVTSDNRGTVQKWMTAKGVPANVAKGAKLATLAKAYNDTSDRYVNAIIRNTGDDAPEFTSPDTDATPEATQGPRTVDLSKFREQDKQDMTPANKADAAHHLAAALSMIGGAGISEERVIELINEHAPTPEPKIIRHEIVVKERDVSRTLSDEPRHEVFPDVLAMLAAGEHVLLVGPAGCGKTHLGIQLAAALELPFYFTGAVPNEYKLTGFKDANGNYHATAFRRAFEEGGLFLWDEMDASSASAMLAFNAALANGHMDFPDGNISRHERARFIASANTYGHGADRQYVGRNQMDAASLDRFAVISMDYDEDMERALYGENEWTSYVQRARKAARTLNVRHVISMRAIKAGAAALGAGVKREKVERAVLWKHLTDADILKIKNAM